MNEMNQTNRQAAWPRLAYLLPSGLCAFTHLGPEGGFRHWGSADPGLTPALAAWWQVNVDVEEEEEGEEGCAGWGCCGITAALSDSCRQ